MNLKLKNKIVFFENELEKRKCSKKISKIVDIDFFILNEIENLKKIKRIDGYKNYFYIFDNSQTTQMNVLDLNYDDDFETIENPFKNNKKSKNVQEDILVQFEDRELIYLDGYLKTLSSTKKYVLKIIEFYTHLLGSLKRLDKLHLYHGNIDFKNIVVDFKENVLLCNFSHSLDLSRNDIPDYFIKLFKEEKSYTTKPLEWHFLKHLAMNKNLALSAYNIDKIIQNYLDKHEVLHHFGKNVLSNLKLEASAFFMKFVNKTYNEISLQLLQFANTWNLFELSMSYLKILVSIQRTIQKTNLFISHFAKLLVENVSTDPGKRHGILKTTSLFNSILEHIEIQDYQDLIYCLDNA